jgi:hypothetical protein
MRALPLARCKNFSTVPFPKPLIRHVLATQAARRFLTAGEGCELHVPCSRELIAWFEFEIAEIDWLSNAALVSYMLCENQGRRLEPTSK